MDQTGGEVKQPGALEDGNWICGNSTCNKINYPSNAECIKCCQRRCPLGDALVKAYVDTIKVQRGELSSGASVFHSHESDDNFKDEHTRGWRLGPLLFSMTEEGLKDEKLDSPGWQLGAFFLSVAMAISMFIWNNPDFSEGMISMWQFSAEAIIVEWNRGIWWSTLGKVGVQVLNFVASLALLDTVGATLVGLLVYHGWMGGAKTDENMNSNKKTPKVLLQLPMFNEEQVYRRIIAAACNLDWPRENLIVQVLDDSTEEAIQNGVRCTVTEWQKKGANVRYRHRTQRQSFKAGNLMEGLQENYASECDYVAILDADFEPSPDWLRRTITHLEADPNLALVQTRWTFSNVNDCLLTRWQGIELRWHFLAEQLSGSYLLNFFGFNGTAGVWRRSAIMAAGSWSGDTLTEDMDMAVSVASLGWRFKMLPDVECLSELPATCAAYRRQQHRWTAGPATLARKHWESVCLSQNVGWLHKLYMIAIYIGLRRLIRPIATSISWFLLVLSVIFPQHVAVPYWPLLSLALLHPACFFAFSLRSFPLLPTYALFVSALSPVRFHAVLSGLWGLASSRAWTVTEKLGRVDREGKESLSDIQKGSEGESLMRTETGDSQSCKTSESQNGVEEKKWSGGGRSEESIEQTGRSLVKETKCLSGKRSAKKLTERVFFLEASIGCICLALIGGGAFFQGSIFFAQQALLLPFGVMLLSWAVGVVGLNC